MGEFVIKGIKELVEILREDIEERGLGDPISNNPYDMAYPLNKSNFNGLKPPKLQRKMAFIDGGNQRILGTAEYSIQVNRVYFNIFNEKSRVFPRSEIPTRIEFFSLTTKKTKNGNRFYETSVFPVNKEFRKYLPKNEDLKFDATNREIMVGNTADIERVASMARRFSEWEFSKHIINLELDENDVIVRDGSLQTSLPKERIYTQNAMETAKKKKVIFSGLSKTSALSTSTGLSVISSVQRFADECKIDLNTWCYGPIIQAKSETHRAVVMVVKLNKCADRPFRFEIFDENLFNEGKLTDGMLDVVSALVTNSNDFSFPGYPYGLYDADRLARVKNEEIEVYETELKSELSNQGIWKTFNTLMKAVDAHNKLDEL
ncbi:MAG TPA: DNA double-strand break repair nuclease NurA [Methanobacterium subterraneum]|uniref:DNA double-strand break repair nuclease NurA n=1 Tax=Methanobacterium subterraneum TaxID=59277 RepID=A0A7J4TJF1_9EURY|nr:DNA double-strand break repair nuclease NurA [Methanobacterium subterraneum]